jgi:NTE family protein
MSSNKIENVLVLQGGGSLGAFACGVFKALANKKIKIDIVAGTSIGGINGAIIAGSIDKEHPERTLEEFWLELGENSVNLTHSVLEWLYDKSRRPFLRAAENPLPTTGKLNSLLSTTSSILYGNDKFFVPRWRVDYALKDPQYFDPSRWTYIYDNSPLVKTLEKYIDYNKLQPDGHPNTRLIMTAVNILTSQPLTFDSSRQKITPKHILATSGYPSDNFPWVEPIGCNAIRACRSCVSFPIDCSIISVSIAPGATAFILTPAFAYSNAAALVSPNIACLLAT